MIKLADVQRGYDAWADKPHNAKWVRKIDGTPIANDIVVSIFDALKAIAPQAPVSAVPAAQMHDTGDGFGNRPIWYGDRPPIGTLLYASPPPPAQVDDNALIRELVAALGEFLEFGEYAYSHGREAITKAKAAGFTSTQPPTSAPAPERSSA